ncbi:hypothetical protein L1987_42540 [Smallanthus sonchifolius]|uniref:Uncharacterized protein n=1 Tax=Smallanthus sonchifolius TaxID=185202 RepID=A0ACB9GJ16_9ASTR|nr:hypothetical protein L1987_42540 [Smallanthus sonchifolius]
MGTKLKSIRSLIDIQQIRVYHCLPAPTNTRTPFKPSPSLYCENFNRLIAAIRRRYVLRLQADVSTKA